MTTEQDLEITQRIDQTPPDEIVTYNRQQVGALMRTWVKQNSPRRFAMYEYHDDQYGLDAEVIAWGLDFGDRVITQSPDHRTRGWFSSLDSAHFVLAYGKDVEFVWIDELPVKESPDDQRSLRGRTALGCLADGDSAAGAAGGHPAAERA
jgi:hypothetical protein